jgi:tetratricopeptide (TPR) repeat protein
MKLALAFVLALSFSTTGISQAEVWLANGAVIKGNVVEDDGQKVKVAIVAEGGTGATSVYKYEQLAPQTIYRLRFNRTERDDVKGQIELAAYALDNGVFPSARLSYDLAKKANEAKKAGMEKEIEALYARAPGVVLPWAKKKIEEGDFMAAERALARLCELFPDCAETAEATKLLEELGPKCMKCREDAVDKASNSSKTAKEAAAPAIKQYKAAHESIRKALGEARNPTQAIRILETALEQFKSAQKLLDGAMKKESAESDLAAHYDAWTAKVRDDTVDTYVHMGSFYFARQSYKNALEVVNKGLALDPKNSEAAAMRARIEVAMTESSRWKW